MLSKSRFLSKIHKKLRYFSSQLNRIEMDKRLRNLKLKEVKVVGDGRDYFMK